jgi:hypothetical protein
MKSMKLLKVNQLPRAEDLIRSAEASHHKEYEALEGESLIAL